MAAKRWDASAYHRMHRRGAGGTSNGFRLDPRATISLGLFAILVVASGAVAMEHMEPRESDKVGICHATGDGESGFVFLVVDRDGAEHGHHKSHSGDKVDVTSEADCGPQPSAATASQEAVATCEHMEHEAEPNLTELCTGDVSVVGSGALVGNHAVFEIRVLSLGPGEANEVLANGTLPDVGRAWALGGPDAPACQLTGRAFACDFQDLLAGEERSVQASALRCPQDCGEDLTARYSVAAYNDANATNDAAEAVLVIPECGEVPTSPDPESDAEGGTPDDETTAPSEDPSDGSGNSTGNGTENGTQSPPANGTDGNSTFPSDGNATEPAPAAGDVALRHWAEQDDEQVVLRFEVANLGPGAAENVLLLDALPDVRRSWFLGGEAARDCTLEGRALQCDFGTLQPEEVRSLFVKAYTDRLPCGEHRTSTASVSADDDAQPRNDRSSAGIQARAC